MSSFYQATCPVCLTKKSVGELALLTTGRGVYRCCAGFCRAIIEYRDSGKAAK